MLRSVFLIGVLGVIVESRFVHDLFFEFLETFTHATNGTQQHQQSQQSAAEQQEAQQATTNDTEIQIDLKIIIYPLAPTKI